MSNNRHKKKNMTSVDVLSYINKILDKITPDALIAILKEVNKNKIYESQNRIETKTAQVDLNDEITKFNDEITEFFESIELGENSKIITEFFESNFEFDKDSKWFIHGKHIKEFFNDSNNINVSTNFLTRYLKKAFPGLGERTAGRVGGVLVNGYKGLRIHPRKYDVEQYPDYKKFYLEDLLWLNYKQGTNNSN